MEPLPESAFTAYDKSIEEPANARMSSQGAWVANRNDKKQYLSILFPWVTSLYSIEVAGYPYKDQSVTSLKLFYSSDGGVLFHGFDKLYWKENNLTGSKVTPFPRPFKANVVRIYPQTWNDTIAMKVELYGCIGDEPVLSDYFLPDIVPGIDLLHFKYK